MQQYNDDDIIQVNNVSIQFNMASERVNHLKEYVIKLLKHQLLFQKFEALKDITFSVKRGESWGFVGVNGSGKSTLLKTISGILKPYKGHVKVKGTISPLIELGAGFDGEMTARENIFLLLSILKIHLAWSLFNLIKYSLILLLYLLSSKIWYNKSFPVEIIFGTKLKQGFDLKF